MGKVDAAELAFCNSEVERKTRKNCSDSPRYSVSRKRCQDVTPMHVRGRESESSVTNKQGHGRT